MNFPKLDNFYKVNLNFQLPDEENLARTTMPGNHRQFHDIQWQFSAPAIKSSLLHRKLHPEMVLPLTNIQDLGEGEFELVSIVTVPGGHQLIYRVTNANIMFIITCNI